MQSDQHGANTMEFQLSLARFVNYALIVWPLIFIPISFALYFSYHSKGFYHDQGENQVPTLSDSGSLLPSALVFTYGLHVEAILFAIFFILLYCSFEIKIHEEMQRMTHTELEQQVNITLPAVPEGKEEENQTKEDEILLIRLIHFSELFTCFGCVCCCQTCSPRDEKVDVSSLISSLRYWNKLSFSFGLVASISMSLVGTVPVTLQPVIHGFFAFTMFALGVLHVLVTYYGMVRRLSMVSYTVYQRSQHIFCVFLTLPFNLLLTLIAGLFFITCCPIVTFDIFPVLEFTTTLSLLYYTSIFAPDLQQLVITLQQEKNY
jgi:hypothetical protein